MDELSNKNIAIFGGTFNPIHIGHLITAFEVIEKLNYDQIIFIPANIPAHKKSDKDFAAPKDRMKMVDLSIKGIKQFSSSDIEIKKGGISYTIDTVIELTAKMNYKKKFGIIIGDDLMGELGTWKEISKLCKISDFICLNRKNTIKKKIKINIKNINNRILEISSTDIRKRIKNRLPIDFMVTNEVKNYITKNKLYLG